MTDHKTKDDTIKSTLFFRKHYQVSLMVIVVNLSSIAVLCYLGYRLDLWLGIEKHLFAVLGLIISFPISQLILYKWITKSYTPRIKRLSKDH